MTLRKLCLLFDEYCKHFGLGEKKQSIDDLIPEGVI